MYESLVFRRPPRNQSGLSCETEKLPGLIRGFCPLQGTLEFVPTGVPTLDEFKKKLDSEHETISGRLQEGARARHELQTLKGKLVEELDEGRSCILAMHV